MLHKPPAGGGPYFPFFAPVDAGWSSPVARQAHNLKVIGSNPIPATNGKAPVLGTPYISGYEPIKDASGAIIGVYFVGYKK